jgi:hypothetical protein
MKRKFSLILCRVGGHFFSTGTEDLEFGQKENDVCRLNVVGQLTSSFLSFLRRMMCIFF